LGVSIEGIDEYNLYMTDGTPIDEDELLLEKFVLEADLVLAKSPGDLIVKRMDLKDNVHTSNSNGLDMKITGDVASG